MTLNTPDSSAANSSSLPLAYQRLLALERFKSGFLARTSHELRSPINTIVSLHQLILEDLCEDPEEEKEFIGQSKDAALKMLALFDQITAVSKLDIGREPAKLEAVDLSLLLPEVEMLTTLQAANQNIRYSVELPAEELEIYTDAKWLKNLLVSLIQDAIPKTKFLSVSVSQAEQSITIVIKSDRDPEALQADLDAIANAEALPDAVTPVQTADSIELTTGLVLATAHIALPLINGEFAIARQHTAPENSEHSSQHGSELRCLFTK
ncbi:MAG: HAMP domain-containing sensor histidine kinase [Phormidesmis sp.]